MKMFFRAMLFVLLTSPAFAEGMNMNLLGGDTKVMTQEEHDEQIRNEKEFKAGASKIPTPKVSNDPWGTVRATPPANQKPGSTTSR
jgi:hypothetical protein